MTSASELTRELDLARYLVITFGCSWVCGGVAGLGNLDVVDVPEWLVGVGNIGFLLGPTVGALAVRTGAPRGAVRATVDDLVGPVERRWPALALVCGVGGALCVAALMLVAGAPLDDLGTRDDWLSVPLVLLATTLAATLEEIGWRGTMLPAARSRVGHRTAVVVVGVAWGIWHLPLLLTDTGVNADVPLYAYPALAIGLSAVLASIYDAAGRSPMVSALAHGALNAAMTPVLLASHSNGDLDKLYAVAVGLSLIAGALLLFSRGVDGKGLSAQLNLD